MNLYYKEQPVFGPRGPAGPDGNPIGTVISFMGTTAPKDYMVCDGATYNISDYSELAKFFEEQFGTSNHFGGDGTTTFAVPDTRNLFLRGYHGTAEEQLSEEVGVKQEGTHFPNIDTGLNGSSVAIAYQASSNSQLINMDTYGNFVSTRGAVYSSPYTSSKFSYFTSRPINMAVLYCIKATESYPAENVYSTEETRIGTWIDGKPVYSKTFSGVTQNNTNNVVEFADISDLSIDTVVEIKGVVNSNLGAGIVGIPCTRTNASLQLVGVSIDKKKLNVFVQSEAFESKPFHCTLKYTKTTDQKVYTEPYAML